MKTIDFRKGNEHFFKHECTSYKIDDWIVYACPTCDYVRKFNWKTRKMHVSGGDMDTLHSGFHAPVEAEADKLSLN